MASVIIRTGRNTYNTDGPIAILPTNKAAKALLKSGELECYNGQYLSIVGLSTLDAADRNHVQETLTGLTTLDCCDRDVEEWELIELDGGCYRHTGKCTTCTTASET